MGRSQSTCGLYSSKGPSPAHSSLISSCLTLIDYATDLQIVFVLSGHFRRFDILPAASQSVHNLFAELGYRQRYIRVLGMDGQTVGHCCRYDSYLSR